MSESKLLNCNKCGKDKPESGFHRNRKLLRGYHQTCKECLKQRRIEIKKAKIEAMGVRGFRNKKGDLLKINNFKNEIVKDGKLKHFTLLIPAVSRSGKSTLMTYIVSQIKKLYDLVILVSQNADADIYENDNWDLKIDGRYQKKLVKMLRLFQKKTKRFLNILIVFDDNSNSKTKKDTTLIDLVLNGRNQNISTCILSQSDKLISKNVRKNIKFVILLRQTSPESVESNVITFMLRFIKTPKLSRDDRIQFLFQFLLEHTQDYTGLVLNYDGKNDDEKIKTIKAHL